MNNALSDIFHNQTALTRERLSFCEANIKDLNEWVTTLSIMQLGDTSKALFTAILELNELNCSETLRFDLIQTLHPTINNVLASLEKNFFNQGVISTDRNEHIIELAMLLRCYFASIYLNIAQTSHEQLQKQKFSLFSFKQRKIYKPHEFWRHSTHCSSWPIFYINSICSIANLSKVNG